MSIRTKTRVQSDFILIFILLLLIYNSFVIPEFVYMGFQNDFSIYRFIIVSSYLFLFSFFIYGIKNELTRLIWSIIFVVQLMPESIYYAYNSYNLPYQIVSISLVLVLLILTDKFRPTITKKKKTKNKKYLVYLLSIILFIPYFVRFKFNVNLKNLILVDVYDTRLKFRNYNLGLLGYITAPLTRVFLPISIITGLNDKKIIRVLFFSVLLLYIYMLGALKSILIGLVSALYFYRFDYQKKLNKFLKHLKLYLFSGIILYFFTDSRFLLDIFVRRVFFVPPMLNSQYNYHFKNNFTLYLHSPMSKVLSIFRPYSNNLSMYFGENILNKPGLNANVGVYTEGYISFGILGIILFSLIIVLILNLFIKSNPNPMYFGIIFVYLYYLNTSFLSTLVLSHGLGVAIIVFRFFLSDEYD